LLLRLLRISVRLLWWRRLLLVWKALRWWWLLRLGLRREVVVARLGWRIIASLLVILRLRRGAAVAACVVTWVA
jgi:hypothetical protein